MQIAERQGAMIIMATRTGKGSTKSRTESAKAETNPVMDKLTELGVDTAVADKIIDTLGASSVEQLAGLNESDLVGVGMQVLPARELVKKLNATTAQTADIPMNAMASFDILPQLPSDEDWLKSLKIGGVLKFNRETVIGTVSAALAEEVGLFKVPDKIIDAMEENAKSLDEPVGQEFYEMQRMLTERRYSEIFSAIPGATGRYASKERKNELIKKIHASLWVSLSGFHTTLRAWMENWQATMNNPGVILQMVATGSLGGGVLPQGMMAPPPIDPLRDSAESVINTLNSNFAGTGIPTAMALAYDAQQIRKAIENPNLPAQVGALNRDQMLKKLGIAVSSDYSRLETNLKRYVLGVIELPNVTSGQTELAYVAALYNLGNFIPWNTLGGSTQHKVTGIGGRL